MNLKPLALAAMMLIAAPALTQPYRPVDESNAYQNVNLDAAERNLAAALRSGNDGAVESALGLAARLKLSLPEHRFGLIEAECVRLITSGGTEAIRYKAYLTLNLMGHPRTFSIESRTEYKDVNEMFAAMAERLQITELSYSAVTR